MSKGVVIISVVLCLIVGVFFGSYYLGMQVQKQAIIFMPTVQFVTKEENKTLTIITTTEVSGVFEIIPPYDIDLSDFERVSGAIGIEPMTNQALSLILSNLHEMHKDNVIIMISTHGGTVSDGTAMYDTIRFYRRLGMTIYTMGVGYCDSAGIMLLQAGEKRFLSQTGTMILHNPYCLEDYKTKYVNSQGKQLNTKEEYLKSLIEINTRWLAVFKETSNNNAELIKLWQTPDDHLLSPRDAIRLGLIDGVL